MDSFQNFFDESVVGYVRDLFSGRRGRKRSTLGTKGGVLDPSVVQNIPFLLGRNGRLEIGSPTDHHSDLYDDTFGKNDPQPYNRMLAGRLHPPAKTVVIYGDDPRQFIPLMLKAVQILVGRGVIAGDWSLKWDTAAGVRSDPVEQIVASTPEDLLHYYNGGAPDQADAHNRVADVAGWVAAHSFGPKLRRRDIEQAEKGHPFTYAGRYGEANG